jgi:Domain of unknown function (DUF4091)
MSARQWVVVPIVFLAAAAEAATVWTAPAAVKVRPQAQPPQGANATAAIAAAKNEFESFHVVVTGPATGVSMSLEGLGDGKGHSISGRDVTLYREALINVPQPTGGDGAAGIWPDALVPDVDPIVGEKRNAFPFDVPAGESRAVFVDIHVPADAAPGTYQGTVNVTGGVSAQVPVTLMVWDFAMPSTSTLISAFGMTWNGPCMGHGDGSCSNYAYEKPLRARYMQAALDNHISITIPVLDAPIRLDGTGDWSSFDTYAGPFLDGTANTRLQGAKLTAVKIDGNVSSASLVQAWWTHFKAKGWSDVLFNYICDEPPATCTWAQLSQRLSISTAVDPLLRRLVTTSMQDATANNVASGITLFTPVLDQMENRPGTRYAGNQRALYPATIWWYQSCDSFGCATGSSISGWPTVAIDSDATRNRAMEWMSFGYDISGELYYETTDAYFSGDPWVKQFGFGGSGQGTLFYPGTTGRIGGQTEIPIESFRMKMIRDGMEDYELLARAKQLGFGDQAKQLARNLFPVTYQSTSTAAAIDAGRGQLAQMILQALGNGTSPDGGSDGGNVPPTDPPGSGSPGVGVVTPSPPPVQSVSSSSFFPHGGCYGSTEAMAWVALLLSYMILARIRRRPRAQAH